MFPPGSLCPEAGNTPNAVAQNVKRCRKKLAEYYRAIEGVIRTADLLIESAHGTAIGSIPRRDSWPPTIRLT